MTDQRRGYIGLGSMGAPMAMRLVGWPGGLTIYDVRDEAMTPFAEAGAAVAAGLAEGGGDNLDDPERERDFGNFRERSAAVDSARLRSRV